MVVSKNRTILMASQEPPGLIVIWFPTLPSATDFCSAKTGVRFTLHKDNEKEKDRNAGQIIRADMLGREAGAVFIRQQQQPEIEIEMLENVDQSDWLAGWPGSSELSESSELVCYHHHHQSNGDRDSQDDSARTNQYKYILDKYNTSWFCNHRGLSAV